MDERDIPPDSMEARVKRSNAMQSGDTLYMVALDMVEKRDYARAGAYVLAALGHYIRVLSPSEMESMARKAESDILDSVNAKIMEELYQAAIDNRFKVSPANEKMLISEYSPTSIMMNRYIKDPDLLKGDAQ